MTWNLGTTNQEHLDEHNLFDHAGIATPTPGKILGVSGGKYTQVDAGTGDHDTLINVSPDDHHAENHQARHQAAGADPLSGSVNANARVAIAKNGTLVGTRRRVNLIEGIGSLLTVTDDSGGEEVDVTIGSSIAVLVSVNTTLTSAYSTVLVNSSGGSRTITLPQVSTVPGIAYLIKRVGTNSVIVNRGGTDTLWTDGASATSKTLGSNGAQLGIVGISGVWYVVAERGTIT